MELFEHRGRDLTSILHPSGPTGLFLLHLVIQVLHVHLARWIFKMQSRSRAGFNWPKALYHFWNQALDNLCETCVRTMFNQRVANKVSRKYLVEMGYIIKNIENEDSLWSTVFDPEFASTVKSRVLTCDLTMEIQVAPCICDPYIQTRSLRYGHSTPRQSMFLMPPRWSWYISSITTRSADEGALPTTEDSSVRTATRH